MSTFWLEQWIDEFDIRSIEDAERALKQRRRGLSRVQNIAASVPFPEPEREFSKGSSFVAGRGIDLSGDLDCCHQVCQIKQVQSLFGRALHYFDEIVVAGPSPYRFARELIGSDEAVIGNLIEHVATFLHLRQIGVRDMLIFVQKSPACQEHFMQHAQEVGIAEALEQAHSWVDRLEAEGVVRDLHLHDDHAHYQFEHQDLEHTAWGTIWNPNPSTRDIAESVFQRYAAHLVSDVAAARAAGLPLAAQVQLHESVLTGSRVPTAAEDVAINLQIPVLDQLPVRDTSDSATTSGTVSNAFETP
ncbi:hypothetical protein [Streptomyces sp. NPDC002328]|uniref:hypothetical protein n=1 Tax=Streptomyces sp. NPDC002328 TaxID=3364642 RepID=UPI003680AE8E